MGLIKVHEFITIDGVIDSPTWTFDYPFDPKMGEAITRLMESSEAILLGRNTYEMFAQAWPNRTAEDDPGAPFFNDTTKYVISSTLTDASWQNTTILGGYAADSIRALKERTSGNLYVSGSGALVRGLLTDRLVDELHLFVFPLTLGSGKRLFADGVSTKLRLTETEPYDSGVVHLAYAQQ